MSQAHRPRSQSPRVKVLPEEERRVLDGEAGVAADGVQHVGDHRPHLGPQAPLGSGRDHHHRRLDDAVPSCGGTGVLEKGRGQGGVVGVAVPALAARHRRRGRGTRSGPRRSPRPARAARASRSMAWATAPAEVHRGVEGVPVAVVDPELEGEVLPGGAVAGRHRDAVEAAEAGDHVGPGPEVDGVEVPLGEALDGLALVGDEVERDGVQVGEGPAGGVGTPVGLVRCRRRPRCP